MSTENKIINGKKPLSSKPAKIQPLTDDIFGNPLAIPDDIQADLASKGLVGRWVSAKAMHENQGYHKRGWIIYKRSNHDTMSTKDFLGGNDPSGTVRRGDCVLAYKKSEDVQRHRTYLKQKADRYKLVNKEKAEELRSMTRESGLKASIEEGYED